MPKKERVNEAESFLRGRVRYLVNTAKSLCRKFTDKNIFTAELLNGFFKCYLR